MGKMKTNVHVILKKEELDPSKINNKVVVVFDILLATSTIATLFHYGAKSVIPVENGEKAYEISNSNKEKDYLLVGEYEGKAIHGFLEPHPTAFKSEAKDRNVILSTTNGTVAIKKATTGKRVYAASLLNSESVVNDIVQSLKEENILLVCAGSSDTFCIEDFYGAGYFIECLKNEIDLNYTDSAKAAHLFYLAHRTNTVGLFQESRVGKMLTDYGFEKELEFITQHSSFKEVPILRNGELQVKEVISGKK
jgi:2-phosphosulfolactate phosphatase